MCPVRRQISRHASQLRRDSTDVEKIIWSAVRNRQLAGYKFRRQWTLGRYVVDFACLEAMLVVELDGGQHTETSDGARTAFLETQGFRVMRFWNSEVIDNRDGVLQAIMAALEEQKKALTQPSPAKAGEG